MIDSKFSPKLLWPSIAHDGGHSAQISRNLGHIFLILNFLALTQIFLPDASRHLVRAYDLELLLGKTLYFLIFHENFCISTHGQDIGFILIYEDLSSPSSKLRETIKEQKAEIETLSVKLQRAQWIINYLEK